MRFRQIVRWVIIRSDTWHITSGATICSFFTRKVTTIKSRFIELIRPRMVRCWWKMTTRCASWFVTTWWRIRLCSESNSSLFGIVSSRIQIFELFSDFVQWDATTGQFGNFFRHATAIIYICGGDFSRISSSSQIRCWSNTFRFYQTTTNWYRFKSDIFLNSI